MESDDTPNWAAEEHIPMTESKAIPVDETSILTIASHQKPEISGQSSWELCRFVIRRHPIAVSVVSVVLGTAIATLLGLPVWIAWTLLMIATAVLAVGGVIVAYLRPKGAASSSNSEESTQAEKSSKLPEKGTSSYWWIAAMVGLAISTRSWTKQQDRIIGSGSYSNSPPVGARPSIPLYPIGVNTRKSLEEKKKRAARTSEYWGTAVAALHHDRFSMPPTQGDEPAQEYFTRRYNDFKLKLNQAKSISRQDVDTDLLNLTLELLELDEKELGLVEEYRQALHSLNLKPSQETIQENTRFTEEFRQNLEMMADDEFADLPPIVQQLVADMLSLEEARFEQLRKIEILQARLSERYPNHSFSLPELALASE